MPKRRTNKTVKLVVPDANEAQIKTQEPRSSLHAPSNSNKHWSNRLAPLVEIEQLVMELRLFRSYFNKEQLQKPLLQVLKKTLSNLSIVVSDEENNKNLNVTWKNKRQ